MTRDVLQAILRSTDGIAEKGGSHRVPTEHRVTVFLGTEGRGMTVNEIDEIKLADAFITLVTRETGNVYADYASVFAISIKATKHSAPPRAGFA